MAAAQRHARVSEMLAMMRIEALADRPVDQLSGGQRQPVDLGRAEECAHLRALLASLNTPLVVVPGNHDERAAFRAAFTDHAHLPPEGFLQFAIDDPEWPVRLIGLDTLVPMAGRGELCAQRLAWLAETLAQAPAPAPAPRPPTVILMHHPPFLTGIAHMDALGLTGREAYVDIVSRHPQAELILCGHLHRNIQARVGGRAAMTAPSTAHQVTLDLRPDAPSSFTLEPPGYLLHQWHGAGFTSHHVNIGSHAGPFPFFAEDGQLID